MTSKPVEVGQMLSMSFRQTQTTISVIFFLLFNWNQKSIKKQCWTKRLFLLLYIEISIVQRLDVQKFLGKANETSFNLVDSFGLLVTSNLRLFLGYFLVILDYLYCFLYESCNFLYFLQKLGLLKPNYFQKQCSSSSFLLTYLR